MVLGLLFGILSPVEYQTSAKLLPEARSQSSVGNIIQQYGGILGFGGGGSIGAEDGIPPKLYPDIVESLPYLVELSTTKIRFAEYDTTVTVHTFLNEIYGLTTFDYLKKYTIGLPNQIAGLFSFEEAGGGQSVIEKANQDSIISVPYQQMNTIQNLRDRITIEMEGESGVVTLTVEMPDPYAAAELGQAGITLLKDYLKSYRTEKAKKDLEFVREQLHETKGRFDEAQNRLAEFRDSNVNLATAKSQTRLQELQSQYNLAFNLYNSLSQRLEEAKLRVQEETPVFSVLQPVTLPLGNSKPNWILIILISFFLGGIIGCGWALVEGLGARIREKIS